MKQTKSDTPTVHLDSFRLILQKEFIGRCKKNSAYSMRAFAKFLGIDQSLLSKVMRGQRDLSKENILRMAVKLGFKPSEIDASLSASKKNAQKNTNTFVPLPDDEFSFISEWYHFALLELSKTKNFKADEKKIAQRLGLHVEEARSAIERLRRLGLIRFEEGVWSLNSPNNSWGNSQTTNEARRLLQKSLLERSLTAIEVVPYESRENGSLTVAIPKKRLPEFKQKLKQIRQELGEYFQAEGDLDEVYQLTMSFFPLTKLEGEKK